MDLISRQAAIDALDKRFDNIPMEQTAEILKLRKDLRELPVIQPQSTTGQLNDGTQSTAQSTNLIDRQATIDAVNNAFDRETLLTGFVRSIAVRAIRDMPSVQPERKKGEWIEISSINHTYKCSECGRLLVNVTDGKNNVSKHYPYCHCGADMRGEQQK